MHKPTAQGKGDQQRQEYQGHELFGQQAPEIEDAGPQHLADPDLPDTLLRHKGGHAEQAQTTDQDGQCREDASQPADPLLFGKFSRIGLIGKCIIEGLGRAILSEDFLAFV